MAISLNFLRTYPWTFVAVVRHAAYRYYWKSEKNGEAKGSAKAYKIRGNVDFNHGEFKENDIADFKEARIFGTRVR